MGRGPHIGAVKGHKDGDVADDADATLVGVRFDCQPLIEELPLTILLVLDLLRQVFSPAIQCRGHPLGSPYLPLGPGAQIVGLLQGHEKGEIVQPGTLRPAKLGKGRALVVGGMGAKAGKSLVQQVGLVVDHGTKIDPVVGKVGHGLQVGRREVTQRRQPFGADQHRVPGKGREALVG